MNAIARYLLVFLLGWSGAVWSYSDVIYKASDEKPENIKTIEKTNDISLPAALKPQPTSNNELKSQNVQKNAPTATLNNKQSTEK